MICCYQVTKKISTRYSSTIASSAWGPCNLGPFTDLAISVFREMSVNTVLTQILTSLEYGLKRHLGVRISVYWNFIIHQIFPEFLQPLRDLRTQRFTLFFLGFLFIWFWGYIGLGIIRSPSSIINQLRHWHWRDVTVNPIFPFSSLNFTCCR